MKKGLGDFSITSSELKCNIEIAVISMCNFSYSIKLCIKSLKIGMATIN